MQIAVRIIYISFWRKCLIFLISCYIEWARDTLHFKAMQSRFIYLLHFSLLKRSSTNCLRQTVKVILTSIIKHMKAQYGNVITCSRTSSLGELRSCINLGTAPWSMTTRVCSDVPDATFVNAQAASNCQNKQCRIKVVLKWFIN